MFVRTAFIAATALLLVGQASAGDEAEALVAGATQELTAGELSADELDTIVDTQAIARFALGRHVRALPDADVSRFSTAFDGFLEEVFAEHSQRFQGAQIEVVGSVDRSDRDSIVTTRMTLPGQNPETVRWRVINRDGTWRIVDVQAYGLWMAIEQRAQIASILDRSHDIGAAIDSLGEGTRSRG